ncbi:MAG: pantoate--beta-alanine ligase [Pseudomonadales bacterium]|nr:pantoate--beta-alanine ligase [Pseudomonadales bacterium]
MKTLNTINAIRKELHPLRLANKRIALVPTMGNLHAGHISLVKEALKHADVVVSTIFVNPMQFGPNEDLDSYPRTLEADKEKLAHAGNHFLLTPSVKEIYPNGLNQTTVHVPGCTECLCGEKRPGHFDGVTTVVTKLFNMIQPDVAIFGQKDFQQLTTIRKMVVDLCFPIKIIGVETCREADNLAMSSRNGYLNTRERNTAPKLYHALKQIKSALLSAEKDHATLLRNTRQSLDETGFSTDYLEIRDADTLAKPGANSTRLVILGAAFLGKTRLIDNLTLELNQ